MALVQHQSREVLAAKVVDIARYESSRQQALQSRRLAQVFGQ